MNKDEALRQALDALKTCQIDGDGWSGPHYWFDSEKVGKAITAIKQALEQPEPEPVAWAGVDFDIKTSPPKREWQGLTDEDWKHLYDEFAMGQELDEFAEAIEAKLKERNT